MTRESIYHPSTIRRSRTAILSAYHSQYALEGKPSGVHYITDYISEEIEARIMEIIHSLPDHHPQWVQVRGRRLQCYGGKPALCILSYDSFVFAHGRHLHHIHTRRSTKREFQIRASAYLGG